MGVHWCALSCVGVADLVSRWTGIAVELSQGLPLSYPLRIIET
jgi:hypothetical protein